MPNFILYKSGKAEKQFKGALVDELQVGFLRLSPQSGVLFIDRVLQALVKQGVSIRDIPLSQTDQDPTGILKGGRRLVKFLRLPWRSNGDSPNLRGT